MKITINNKLLLGIFAISLLFFSLLILFSCGKSSGSPGSQNALPVITDTVITDTSLYLDITLDGQRTLGIENALGNQWSWGQVWGGPFSDTGTYVFNRLGTIFSRDTVPNLPLFAFSKGAIDYISMLLRDSITKAYSLLIPVKAIDSFFLPGNYGYSSLTHDTSVNFLGDTLTGFGHTITQRLLSDGVNILWIDKSGKQWQTCTGIADQAGSYFTIVKNQIQVDQSITSYTNGTIVTAKFDCNLYDGFGNSMHLTNGKFRLVLWF